MKHTDEEQGLGVVCLSDHRSIIKVFVPDDLLDDDPFDSMKEFVWVYIDTLLTQSSPSFILLPSFFIHHGPIRK